MSGFAPFIEHRRNQTVGTDADISSADDQVMGFDVSDVCFLVSGDAFVLIVPFFHEQANGTTDQLRQVAHNEPGVFASEFDLATEAEVVTNEHGGTSDNTSGKGLVVAVTETQNPAIIFAGCLGVNFHQTEIALAFMRQ